MRTLVAALGLALTLTSCTRNPLDEIAGSWKLEEAFEIKEIESSFSGDFVPVVPNLIEVEVSEDGAMHIASLEGFTWMRIEPYEKLDDTYVASNSIYHCAIHMDRSPPLMHLTVISVSRGEEVWPLASFRLQEEAPKQSSSNPKNAQQDEAPDAE